MFIVAVFIVYGCSSPVSDVIICNLSYEIETENSWYLDSAIYKSSHGLASPEIVRAYDFLPVQKEPQIDSAVVQKRAEQFYPEELKSKKVVGTVLIRALFDQQGIIKAAVIERTDSSIFN